MSQKLKIFLWIIILATIIIVYFSGNIFGFGMNLPHPTEGEKKIIDNFERVHKDVHINYKPEYHKGERCQYVRIMNNIDSESNKSESEKRKLADDFFNEFIKFYSQKSKMDSFKIEVENSKTTFYYKIPKPL
jgi:hypothetical protein